MVTRISVLVGLLASCSNRVSTTAADSTPPPPMIDAGPPVTDGSSPSPADHAGADDKTLSIARSPRSVKLVRDHHTTNVIVVGGKPYLYVIGGTNAWTTIYDDVLRAPIGDDGSLGEFEPAGALPEPRAGHAAVVLGNWIIVSGGNSMSGAMMQLLDSTVLAPIGPDGTLSAWTTGPRLPAPIMHHTCDANGRFVYCIGGRIAGNFTSGLSVRASFSDGTLSAYEGFAPLPQSIGFHQSFVRGGYLYLAGGLHRDPPMPDFDRLALVSRIALREDGSAGAWEPDGNLPEPRYASAAQVAFGDVYLFGGQNGNGDAVDTIMRGSFDAQGRLANVGIAPAKLSVARMHVHHVPSYGDWIYSVGGRTEANESIGVIDIGTFR
jgi:hypothetical protein